MVKLLTDGLPQYPNILLNHLLAMLNLRNDAQLAKRLGIHQTQMSRFRNQSGRTFELTPGHILAIYDATGLSVERVREILYQRPFPRRQTNEETKREHDREMAERGRITSQAKKKVIND